MGLTAVAAYLLIAAGPGLAAWCLFIGTKSFLVLLSLASSFLWLVSLMLIALLLRGFLPWISGPAAYAAVLVFSVSVQEGCRVGVFHLHKRMLTILNNLARQADGASLCFEDRHSLALAHGMGHAIAHSTFFYLCWVPMAMGDGTLYLDACPSMSLFLYAALCSLAFFTLHASSMIVAFDALAYKRPRQCLTISGLHLAAALLSLINFAHNGCLATAPLLLYALMLPRDSGADLVGTLPQDTSVSQQADESLTEAGPSHSGPLHPARILISGSRKPVSYINLSKRFLAEHGEVQLSALGTAIASAVALAEILKARGLAFEKGITTALENLADAKGTRQKPKLEIVLTKTPDFDTIIYRETQEADQSSAHMRPADASAALGGLRLQDDP
ncbi:hypothetical protein WJX73_000274 [Symbiochloris irregularis]|uniref:DNA/RNA-binding protein Alba-like domain-containing protein n=1 Tax=Symbiochloris irregularis TaxID=706552 RepID=A0AAW1P2H0_9CHLO